MGLKRKEVVLSLNSRTLSQDVAKAKSKTRFRKAWTDSAGQVYQEPSRATEHYPQRCNKLVLSMRYYSWERSKISLSPHRDQIRKASAQNLKKKKGTAVKQMRTPPHVLHPPQPLHLTPSKFARQNRKERKELFL